MSSSDELTGFLDEHELYSAFMGDDFLDEAAEVVSSELLYLEADALTSRETSSFSSSSKGSSSPLSRKPSPADDLDSLLSPSFPKLLVPAPMHCNLSTPNASTVKSSLSFWNNSQFPPVCNPQVPKKIHLRLKGYSRELGQPQLIIRLWAEQQSAVRISKAGAWQRDSLECRTKRREGKWVGGLDIAFPFVIDPKSEDYVWGSYVQFTHLTHYENGRHPSTGRIVVLFYVKGSLPDSKEELMLKTCPISVVGRDSKKKKNVLEANSLPHAPSETSKRPRIGSRIADFARRRPSLEDLPRQKMLATKWFNEVYPEKYELCNMITDKPLREFSEDERASLPQLAIFFDKAALIMAEAESDRQDISELAKAVQSHMVKTKFNSCAVCTLRANEIRNMYNNFEGEWWNDKEINERFRGSHGMKNTVLSKISSKLDNIDAEFDDFEAKKAEAPENKNNSNTDLVSRASKLDVPGLLISFERFSLDIITCARMDIDTMIKMHTPLESTPCGECVGDRLTSADEKVAEE